MLHFSGLLIKTCLHNYLWFVALIYSYIYLSYLIHVCAVCTVCIQHNMIFVNHKFNCTMKIGLLSCLDHFCISLFESRAATNYI